MSLIKMWRSKYLDPREEKYLEDGKKCVLNSSMALHNTSDFITLINSRRLLWHVACIMEIRNTHKVLPGKTENMGCLNVEERIVLLVSISTWFLKDNRIGNTNIT